MNGESGINTVHSHGAAGPARIERHLVAARGIEPDMLASCTSSSWLRMTMPP